MLSYVNCFERRSHRYQSSGTETTLYITFIASGMPNDLRRNFPDASLFLNKSLSVLSSPTLFFCCGYVLVFAYCIAGTVTCSGVDFGPYDGSAMESSRPPISWDGPTRVAETLKVNALSTHFTRPDLLHEQKAEFLERFRHRR